MEDQDDKARNWNAYMHRLMELYARLEDDISRKCFWARLEADVDLELRNSGKTSQDGLKLLSRLFHEQTTGKTIRISDSIQAAVDRHEQIIVYGVRMTGLRVALSLNFANIDFCFVSRGNERFPNGILGKPVHSPEWLSNHTDNAFVILCATEMYGGYEEIRNNLQKLKIPQSRIISYQNVYSYNQKKKQYFEFPEMIPRGKAFVDCGCYDGSDSLSFVECCQNNDSKIFAFEPDPVCFQKCEQTLQNARIQNLVLSSCGLSDRPTSYTFFADGSSHSFVVEEEDAVFVGVGQKSMGEVLSQKSKLLTIPTTSIDAVVKNEPVGFIKMDIEGFERKALQGAKNTIMRDRPLLAICVYHKAGDVLDIMDYCQQLVPEYKFWLRQYDFFHETVLYASSS